MNSLFSLNSIPPELVSMVVNRNASINCQHLKKFNNAHYFGHLNIVIEKQLALSNKHLLRWIFRLSTLLMVTSEDLS